MNKKEEYVKLDDVMALLMADINHLDADKKNIVGNGTIAQIQRTMADALRKHSSSMLDNVMNHLRRYEF